MFSLSCAGTREIIRSLREASEARRTLQAAVSPLAGVLPRNVPRPSDARKPSPSGEGFGVARGERRPRIKTEWSSFRKRTQR